MRELGLGGTPQALLETQMRRLALFRDPVKGFDRFGSGRRAIDANIGLGNGFRRAQADEVRTVVAADREVFWGPPCMVRIVVLIIVVLSIAVEIVVVRIVPRIVVIVVVLVAPGVEQIGRRPVSAAPFVP